MKIQKLLSVVALAAILFTSCKKDGETVTPTTLQKIQGTWTFQKEISHDFNSGVHYRDTTYGITGDYADFRTDGKVYSRFVGGYDTASYSILGNNKLITSTGGLYPSRDTADITVLSNNQLQFYSKTFDPAPDYSESTIFFIK